MPLFVVADHDEGRILHTRSVAAAAATPAAAVTDPRIDDDIGGRRTLSGKRSTKDDLQGLDDLGVDTDVEGDECAAGIETGGLHPAHGRTVQHARIRRDLPRIRYQFIHRVISIEPYILTVDRDQMFVGKEERVLQSLSLIRRLEPGLHESGHQSFHGRNRHFRVGFPRCDRRSRRSVVGPSGFVQRRELVTAGGGLGGRRGRRALTAPGQQQCRHDHRQQRSGVSE